jgi:hypothetical protein
MVYKGVNIPVYEIKAALFLTNSIVQGEQTSILWGQMINKYGIKFISLQNFKWSNKR